MSGEIWEAVGKYVYRGKDCIGIFDTDNATEAFMEERARVAAAAPELLDAASNLLADVRRRYPGEELRCEFMRALDVAIIKATSTPASGRSYP